MKADALRRRDAPGPARWAGSGAAALSIVLLGSNWPVMQIALRDTTPLWLASGRMAVACVLYVLLLAARGGLAWPDRREWRLILALGVLQSAAMNGLVTVGIGLVGAGRSVILAYTTPIWVIPAAALLLRERPTRPQLLGLGVGGLGMLALFNPAAFDWSSRSVLIGNVVVLAGAVAWSGAMLAARGHRWRLSPLQLMPFQALLGSLLLMPAAAWLEGFPHASARPGFLACAAYASVGATFLAFWMVVEAARRLPAARMSLAQLATPVLGIAATALWVGERLPVSDFVGLGLILAGVAVSVRPARPA